MTKDSGKFAGLLDTYVHQAGLPLRRVASQSGIPHQTLFNWLNGTQPRWHAALPKDLHRLGDTLGLAEEEMTQLLRSAGCMAARSGLFDSQEFAMENNWRLPKGWFVAGDNPAKYSMGIDDSVTYENRPCVSIKGSPDSTSFATLMQSFKAEAYLGKRLRFSAAVRTANVQGWAALWMRVDDAEGKILAFDNMERRPITSTTDWTYYAIVLGVAKDATGIFFGILLSGDGQTWMSDVQLDEVGEDVPVTDTLGELPKKPVNLGFDE
jgi:hypothetical protein